MSASSSNCCSMPARSRRAARSTTCCRARFPRRAWRRPRAAITARRAYAANRLGAQGAHLRAARFPSPAKIAESVRTAPKWSSAARAMPMRRGVRRLHVAKGRAARPSLRLRARRIAGQGTVGPRMGARQAAPGPRHRSRGGRRRRAHRRHRPAGGRAGSRWSASSRRARARFTPRWRRAARWMSTVDSHRGGFARARKCAGSLVYRCGAARRSTTWRWCPMRPSATRKCCCGAIIASRASPAARRLWRRSSPAATGRAPGERVGVLLCGGNVDPGDPVVLSGEQA